MRSAEFYAILLASVMLTGIFSLSPAISSLTNNVVIKSTGKIAESVIANSGSREDIQAAVDEVSASGGGVVYIPEGEFAFYPSVSIPGGVSVVGAGKDKTVLYMPGEASMGANMFNIYGENGKPVRISGIHFIGYAKVSEDGNYGGLRIDDTKDFRIDHCIFEDFAGAGIWIWNYDHPEAISQGVIDHCEFLDPYHSVIGGIWGYGVCVFHDYSVANWEMDINKILGKYNETVFIEDCYFEQCRHAVAANGGAHYVFRYNTLTKIIDPGFALHYIDAHGTYNKVGTRCVEIYDNVIKDPIEYEDSIGVAIRGGGGVIFNNTFQGIRDGIWLVMEKWGAESPGPEYTWPHDIWIWDNTYEGVQTILYTEPEIVENEDYFLFQKTDYIPYPYPHPLTLGP